MRNNYMCQLMIAMLLFVRHFKIYDRTKTIARSLSISILFIISFFLFAQKK